MAYCSNCGNKISSKTKFCGNCGEKIERVSVLKESPFHYKRKRKEPVKKESPINLKNRVLSLPNIKTPLIENSNYNTNKKSSGFWKIILWTIIILSILYLVFNLLINIENSGGGFGVSSSRDDNWWGTTHKRTSVGLGGVQTEEHSCPFWNRNC